MFSGGVTLLFAFIQKSKWRRGGGVFTDCWRSRWGISLRGEECFLLREMHNKTSYSRWGKPTGVLLQAGSLRYVPDLCCGRLQVALCARYFFFYYNGLAPFLYNNLLSIWY